MTTFRSAVFAFVGIVAVSFLSSCNHSTSVQNNESSIPRVGSIFVYADTGIDPFVGPLITTEYDTVVGSGTLFSKSNAIHFDSSARDLISFTSVNIDSMGGAAISEIIETFINGPFTIAYESTGDISMPAILTMRQAHDSTMQWMTFPVASHSTFQLTFKDSTSNLGDQSTRDSVISAANVSIEVNGTSYECEHAIDYHFYPSDSGMSPSPSKLEIYFSPSLGVPVRTVLSVQNFTGTAWIQAYSKELSSFTD